jgi:hypothetical protein
VDFFLVKVRNGIAILNSSQAIDRAGIKKHSFGQ